MEGFIILMFILLSSKSVSSDQSSEALKGFNYLPTPVITVKWKTSTGIGGFVSSTVEVMIVVGLFYSIVFGIGFCIKLCRGIIKSGIKFAKSRTQTAQANRKVELFCRYQESMAPKRYTYLQIKIMTNFLREKLGEGGYSVVYKGKLICGRLVAVKLLKQSKGDGQDFINEVASVSGANHVNVVSLLGFCFEGSKRCLVYEFMPNGSLEKYRRARTDNNNNQPLTWETWFKISLGIARGLEYLHRGCNTSILHFDIKPHNILLEENFCPKISDFGLAKLCPQTERSKVFMSEARGTVGYIAPEVFCRNFGEISQKSDVYSYGMLVLEVIGFRENANANGNSRSSEYFPQWIYKHLNRDQEQEAGEVDMDEDDKSLQRKMILVSLWCIQTFPFSRPSIDRVVQMLEGSLDSIEVPPIPTLASPPRPPLDPSGSSTITIDSFSEVRMNHQSLCKEPTTTFATTFLFAGNKWTITIGRHQKKEIITNLLISYFYIILPLDMSNMLSSWMYDLFLSCYL